METLGSNFAFFVKMLSTYKNASTYERIRKAIQFLKCLLAVT